MLLLAVAGVSLAASAVAWWNGKRIEEVEREIAALEERGAAIHGADATERRRLIAPYVEVLERAIAAEQRFRSEVADELKRASGEVRAAIRRPMGLDDGAMERVMREVQEKIAQLDSERAWLTAVRRGIEAWRKGDLTDLIGRDGLLPPLDFPMEGRLAQLPSGLRTLFDYELRWTDLGQDLEGPAALFQVDHEGRRARACRARGALLAALSQDDPDPLVASVVRDDLAGLVLEHGGIPLLLPREHGHRLRRVGPGDRLDVYPGDWLMSDALRPPMKSHPSKFLRVRLEPRLEASVRRRWSPIPRAVPEKLLKGLVEGIDDRLVGRPWSIRSVPGTADLSLRLGSTELRVSPDLDAGELTLQKVLKVSDASSGGPGLRVAAELYAYAPYSKDAKRVDRQQMGGFLEALHHELSDHNAQLVRRRGQLALRKLSAIYADQLDREERDAAVNIFVADHRKARGGSELDVIALDEHPPDWLGEACDDKRPRVAVETARDRFDVTSLKPLHESSGTYRLRVRDLANREAGGVRRLVSTRSGVQQRVLIRALEDTMLGLTTNPEIRRHLLEAGVADVKHELEGPDAIREAAMKADDLFAVWGPPGAGKTTLIVGLIADFLRSRGDRPTNVLVVAPTHVAVDNVLHGLASAHPDLEPVMVRYASDAKIEDSSVERLWYRHAVDAYKKEVSALPDHGTTERWREVIRGRAGDRAVTRWILSAKKVHGATCVGMASARFGLTDRTYDLVVIDEVGKCFAAELLLPATKAQRLIVVGDHYQLPPTVTSESLDESIGYRLPLEEVEELLRESYFEMLFRSLPADRKGMLTTQYRMHPHIGDAISEVFYEGHLDSGRTEGFGEWMASRLTVVDCSELPRYRSRPGPFGRSRVNDYEAEGVVRLLLMIREERGKLPETLIVCPYLAQRNRLRKAVSDSLGAEPVHVTTVDAVQGGEAPLVVLPMTRERGRAEFVLDENRLNVALSRAKDGVVVFAHVDHLTRNAKSPVQRLLDHGAKAGTVNHLRLRPSKKARLREQLRGAIR